MGMGRCHRKGAIVRLCAKGGAGAENTVHGSAILAASLPSRQGANMNRYRHTLPALLMFVGMTAHANQDCYEMDIVLKAQLQALEEVAFPYAGDGVKNNRLNAEIKSFLKANANNDTWECAFPLASRKLNIFTSEDKKFRAYAWDDQQGGTMRYFGGLWQYRDDAGNTHIMDAHPEAEEPERWGNSGFVKALYTARLGEKGTAYWLIEVHPASSKITISTAIWLHIVNNKLEYAYLIDFDGRYGHEFRLDYDYFSIVENPVFYSKVPDFSYNDNRKEMRVPIVDYNDSRYSDGRMTDKEEIWRFNGQYFVPNE